MKLELLASNTIFTYDGNTYRVDGREWLSPPAYHPEAKRDNVVGVASRLVTPKFGGQFQPRLSFWLPMITEVVVAQQ